MLLEFLQLEGNTETKMSYGKSTLRQQDSRKRWFTSVTLHSTTFQKAVQFNVTATRTSNLTNATRYSTKE